MIKSCWYLVYTKPQKEALALQQLSKQGYTAYLPTISKEVRRRGRLQSVVEPLFPRYLFICLNTQVDNWGPIRSTVGVSHLVRFGLSPAKVPEKFVHFLQQQELAAEQQCEVPRFVEGDKVTIAEGPFAGVEAVFSEARGDKRAIVLLKIANRFTHLSVEQGCLDKAV